MQFLLSKVVRPLRPFGMLVYRGLLTVPEKMRGQAMPQRFKKSFHALQNKKGAFIAAPHPHYEACWIRDQLYSALSFFYTGEIQKFKEGVWVVFDILHKHRVKIEELIIRPPRDRFEHNDTVAKRSIHAKVHHETFEEIAEKWGHHQLDAIGLFLYVVGFAQQNGIDLIRDGVDKKLIERLVVYLEAIRYSEFPDNGMWEEAMDIHASSIGACVAGLTLVRDSGLVSVPQDLINRGMDMLYGGGTILVGLLPNESPDRDRDMAELSLIWPYNIAIPDVRDAILKNVKEKLAQPHGLNRYWGDEYYRSQVTGASAQWPMGFFWLSIIYSKLGEKEEAAYWFERGQEQMTSEGAIPELYIDDTPNEHTPLAWAHAMAIIAAVKVKK